jgi:hypothetical protein
VAYPKKKTDSRTLSSNKRTHRGRGEDELIKGAARPVHPMLQGVVRHNLLIVLGIVAGPKNGRPRSAGKLEASDFTACCALRQGHACLLDLLDLRGGDPCRSLRGGLFLGGSSRLAEGANLVGLSGDWTRR